MRRYYITDRKSLGGFRPLMEVIRDQMHLGVDYIQIREKDVPARQLFEFTLAVLEVRQAEFKSKNVAKVLVNGRSDVAIAAGADGVHLPSAAPQECLPGLMVARSCHTMADVQAAQADLITFGPVFESPGKGEPVGLDALREACQGRVPVFALGGVNWENAADCVAAGAEGIAGIRLFQDPSL